MVKVCQMFFDQRGFLILRDKHIFCDENVYFCCISAMTHCMTVSIFSWTQSCPGFILVFRMCLELTRLVHVTSLYLYSYLIP